MPVPSETVPGCAVLPLIDRAAAREMFRTAECTGLGRPGTDEIFDEWLGRHSAIGFYRNGVLPLQARPVNASDGWVPQWLTNSRVGEARLEAVHLTSSRPAPPPDEGPAIASSEAEVDEEIDETDEDDETDTGTCDGMPGLCWRCEPDKERYAKIDSHHDPEDGDGDPWVLQFVNTYPGGMGEDPSYGLSGEFPPHFSARSIRELTVLTEVAQRKLDTESWDTDGSWRLIWSSCESDITNPECEGEDFDSSDDDLDGESDEIRYFATIDNEDDVLSLRITGARWGERHVFYSEPVSGPGGEPLDAGTVEGLLAFLERATEQVNEAGYEIDGEWAVDWLRCYVLLND